jgi:hypothetical protein
VRARLVVELIAWAEGCIGSPLTHPASLGCRRRFGLPNVPAQLASGPLRYSVDLAQNDDLDYQRIVPLLSSSTSNEPMTHSCTSPHTYCYACGGAGEVTVATGACESCSRKVIDDRAMAWCDDCMRDWEVRVDVVPENRGLVIDDGASERFFCYECSVAPEVWCPKCGKDSPDAKPDACMADGSSYLWVILGETPYLYHAACLVTHYRHHHIRSWDRMHSNRRYQSAIPNCDYDKKKVEVNNRAKRQLLRALISLHKSRSVPSTIEVPQLILGFSELQENDQNTDDLIKKLLAAPEFGD